ncbi:MAG: hypothetical protein ACE5E5_04225 [Phycisphaerae bacterium]
MRQVFIGLSVSNVFLLLGTFLLGLRPERFGGADRHILLAVLTCMLTCLVQVVVFTFLSVSGRLISQAVHLGTLPPTPIETIRGLKRRTGRCLAGLALLLVLAVASGAAHWRSGAYAWPHFLLVSLFLAAHFPVLLLEWQVIDRTRHLVDETMGAYRLARANRQEAVSGS